MHPDEHAHKPGVPTWVLAAACALIFVLAIVAGTRANAEGLLKRTAAAHDEAPAPRSWTGPYIGLHAGLAATSTDVGGVIELSGDGTQLGLNAGYDQQFGKMVAGVWAEYTWADIQTSFGGTSVATLKGSWAAGGRLGFLLTDRLLAYVKAGWTQMEASSAIASMPTFDGYLLGFGAEALLSDAFSMKLEYVGTMLQSETVGGPGGVSFEPDSHAVRIGGAWRFNMPALKQ